MARAVSATARLPEVALAALLEIPTMRRELEIVREQTSSMPHLLPAMERLEAQVDRLGHELADVRRHIAELHDDVRKIPGVEDDSRGLVERARDAVTPDR